MDTTGTVTIGPVTLNKLQCKHRLWAQPLFKIMLIGCGLVNWKLLLFLICFVIYFVVD